MTKKKAVLTNKYPEDHIGQKFGLLTILGIHSRGHQTRVLCRCDCGKECTPFWAKVNKGKTRSCGCQSTGTQGPGYVASFAHHFRTYSSWKHMILRCENDRNHKYKSYGGRGIAVCERWHEFYCFVEDVGLAPDGMTIDRYPDNDGNYSCGRCNQCVLMGWQCNARWATQCEQQNNRRNNVRLTFNGDTLTAAQWERRRGWTSGTITARLARGWPSERALTQEPKRSR